MQRSPKDTASETQAEAWDWFVRLRSQSRGTANGFVRLHVTVDASQRTSANIAVGHTASFRDLRSYQFSSMSLNSARTWCVYPRQDTYQAGFYRKLVAKASGLRKLVSGGGYFGAR